MKLLLENWRKYLAERATDEAFAQTVDFLVDTFTDPKNFEFVNDEEEEEYLDDLDGLSGAELMDLLREELRMPSKAGENEKEQSSPASFEFAQVEPRMEDNWDRFVEKHPGVAEQLGLDPGKLRFYFILKVVYGYSEENKSMESNSGPIDDKTTAGYFDGEELVINLKGSRFNVTEERYREMEGDDILNLLRKKADIIRMVVDHEFTHMLNYLRAGKRTPRAKGLKRHHYQRPEEMQMAIKYANSTEEIQARLIPIFKIVHDVEEMDQDKIPKTDVNEVAKLVNIEAVNFSGNKSLSNIIKLLYQMYELHHPKFLKWTSKSNKKRITKRFFEFAEDLVSK